MGVKLEYERHSKRVTATKRWQVLRAAVLERDGWKCRACGKRGRLEIDHIQPVRTHPSLAFEPLNCQALCPSCHTKKTRIECGHPALIKTPARTAWGQAVADMAAKPKSSGELYA